MEKITKIVFEFKKGESHDAAPAIIKHLHENGVRFAVSFPDMRSTDEYAKRRLGDVMVIYAPSSEAGKIPLPDITSSRRMQKVFSTHLKSVTIGSLREDEPLVAARKIGYIHNTSPSYVKNFLKKYVPKRQKPKNWFLQKIAELYEKYEKIGVSPDEAVFRISSDLKTWLAAKKEKCQNSEPFIFYESSSRKRKIPIFIRKVVVNQPVNWEDFNSLGLYKKTYNVN